MFSGMYIVANSPPPGGGGGIKCRIKWMGKKMQGWGKKNSKLGEKSLGNKKKGRERVKNQGKTLKEG